MPLAYDDIDAREGTVMKRRMNLILAVGLLGLGGCAAPDEGMWPFFANSYDSAKARDDAEAHHLCVAAPLTVEAVAVTSVIARDARGDYIHLEAACRLDPKTPVAIIVADGTRTPCIGDDFVLQFRGQSGRVHNCPIDRSWRMTPADGAAEAARDKLDPTGNRWSRAQ
jgi:hypothetical protein